MPRKIPVAVRTSPKNVAIIAGAINKSPENCKIKAWHAVQEYLNALGKKYNYDPEKFVINKITRELEPYSPESDG